MERQMHLLEIVGPAAVAGRRVIEIVCVRAADLVLPHCEGHDGQDRCDDRAQRGPHPLAVATQEHGDEPKHDAHDRGSLGALNRV